MKAIYAAHQGFELYGSDRVFIRTLHALRAEWPQARITASIPAEGTLADALRADGFEVTIDDLWVLRRSLGVRLPLRLLKLPLAMFRAWKRGQDADLVYISTTVIMDHMLVAPLWRGGVIVHVHELPTGVTATILSGLLRWSRAALVFISKATEDAYALSQGTVSQVIHNGHEGPKRPTGRAIRSDGPLRVLMIGRINDWKGQDLLVEAIALLSQADRERIEVRVVGDTFGGPASKDALLTLIAVRGLEGRITVEGFLDDPSPAYEWSDIVAAPSRNPEPFGLIAIEAMSWSRPVVAAGHGGLIEIVEDGRTGRLFTPNDPASLAQALRAYVVSPRSVADHGSAGRSRYERAFTGEAYARSFVAFARRVVDRKKRGAH